MDFWIESTSSLEFFKLDLWKKPLWRHFLMSIENSFKKGITMSKNNASRLQLYQ